ncbi:MAG TPA: DUF202 domain-containing protein [Solimonas sp.]
MSELDDPRVLFSAERTLLAWNRTCLTLMAFGFVVERFGLFLQIFGRGSGYDVTLPQLSHVAGIGFLLLGVVLQLLAVVQYRRLVRTLRAGEIPRGYWINLAVVANLLTAALGLSILLYLVF